MGRAYHTVLQGGEGRYEEKKSVFIGETLHVESEEAALAFVEERRKQYWDARHHCFAYVLGEKSEQVRAADDGEPSGTAGRPILDVLTGAGLTNTALVVTRYFGGTLLGTGGLVRAYTAAARAAVAASEVVEKIYGAVLQLTASYTDFGRLQYLLAETGVPTLAADYADAVTLRVIVPAEEAPALTARLTDATAARVKTEPLREVYYYTHRGQVMLED